MDVSTIRPLFSLFATICRLFAPFADYSHYSPFINCSTSVIDPTCMIALLR